MQQEGLDNRMTQNSKPTPESRGLESNQPAVSQPPKTVGSPANPSQLPEIKFIFFVASSVTNKNISGFINSSMAMLRSIWRPIDVNVKQFQVNFSWDGSFKTIDDKNQKYRRILFPRNFVPPIQVLTLVNDNYANTAFKAEVPVFICEVAWDEMDEPGVPRDGDLRGFTIVNILPWFKGERAILIFSMSAKTKTLAHELSHWIGFTHGIYSEDPTNIASIGGGGFRVDRDEFRRLYNWATDINYRKKLSTQLKL